LFGIEIPITVDVPAIGGRPTVFHQLDKKSTPTEASWMQAAIMNIDIMKDLGLSLNGITDSGIENEVVTSIIGVMT